MTKGYCMIALTLLVAGCGGGGGGPSPMEPPPVAPFTAVQFSDLLFSGRGYTNARVDNVACSADLSACTATFKGIPLSFSADPTAAGDGTAYTSLGDWAHIQPVVVEVAAEGLEGRLAAVRGRTRATTLPVALGSATWEGTMVALDSANQVVRGGATLTIADLATPTVEVELTPAGRAPMTWDALPVTNGAFAAHDSDSDYLNGAFYGPDAEEVGGVFERHHLLGAFGATR